MNGFTACTSRTASGPPPAPTRRLGPIEQIDAGILVKPIGTPTITIGSDFDGPAEGRSTYRELYTGPYRHRVLDGIGHNVAQEAPQGFASAITDVTRRQGAHS